MKKEGYSLKYLRNKQQESMEELYEGKELSKEGRERKREKKERERETGLSHFLSGFFLKEKDRAKWHL